MRRRSDDANAKNQLFLVFGDIFFVVIVEGGRLILIVVYEIMNFFSIFVNIEIFEL